LGILPAFCALWNAWMPDYSFFSDEQLVKAARDGEDAAWEALVRRHGQRLLAFFVRMNGGDLAGARERWINLWGELARQRPSLASGPRFTTVAFNTALKSCVSIVPKVAARSNAEPSSLEARSDRIYRALASLPTVQRAALCLSYLDNLPWDKLGQILGCRAEEAKAHCADAYARFDATLGPGFFSPDL
jgi:DNA-directed RNA polymerase specialized sigma24 family protein